MIKRIIALVMACMMLGGTAFAAEDIKVLIDGKEITFDVKPQIINNRTMVPMRKIFETLGAEVEWFGESRLILATRNELVVAMEVGKPSFSVTDLISGGTKTVLLDSPSVIVNNRTLVPARAISESIGYSVDWDAENRTVLITSPVTK